MKRVATSLILVALILLGANNAFGEESAGARDPLCGWYKLTTGNRLIPVFKIEKTYYTVLSRGGFEIPLEECPDGLEWPRSLPSSMVGTKIGFDKKSNEVYISIVDQNREYQEASFTSGEKQSLTAVDKPSWLRDATAQPARTCDDFLGWYEPVWFPYVRGQIRREGRTYLLAVQLLQTDGKRGSWVSHSEHYELTPLSERPGFAIRPERDEGPTFRLLYSAARRRFELQVIGSDAKSQVGRMPLARIPAPSADQDAAPVPPMDIGIPSWN